MHGPARVIRVLALLAGLALVAAAALQARQDSAATPATVMEVMTSMTIPASDVIFDAASDPPDTDAQWATLRGGAETLAASGRLLMTDRLARDTTTWMDRARALVMQAEATVRLADARARDRLDQASDEIYATCKACHDRYLEP